MWQKARIWRDLEEIFSISSQEAIANKMEMTLVNDWQWTIECNMKAQISISTGI